MGKLAKPQRSKKHKKIKAISIDPFYAGKRKDSQGNELNQKPKNYNQEVPKKLRHLGLTVDGVREGKVGKKSKNKFHKQPDGPDVHPIKSPTPSGSKSSSSNASHTLKGKKVEKIKQGKKGKKAIKSKISDEVFNEYVDNLQPARPFVAPFTFRKKQDETEKQFNRRVNAYAHRALTKSKIDDHFALSDEKKMLQKMAKLKKGMSDKKKQRLKDRKLRKAEAVKGKKLDKLQGFDALQDKVEFGETVHAPPTLSVRPKKAVVSEDVDRPGRRMPELHAMIAANVRASEQEDSPSTRHLGTSVKRRNLTTLEQRQADSKREMAIEAYRQLKKRLKH